MSSVSSSNIIIPPQQRVFCNKYLVEYIMDTGLSIKDKFRARRVSRTFMRASDASLRHETKMVILFKKDKDEEIPANEATNTIVLGCGEEPKYLKSFPGIAAKCPNVRDVTIRLSDPEFCHTFWVGNSKWVPNKYQPLFETMFDKIKVEKLTTRNATKVGYMRLDKWPFQSSRLVELHLPWNQLPPKALSSLFDKSPQLRRLSLHFLPRGSWETLPHGLEVLCITFNISINHLIQLSQSPAATTLQVLEGRILAPIEHLTDLPLGHSLFPNLRKLTIHVMTYNIPDPVTTSFTHLSNFLGHLPRLDHLVLTLWSKNQLKNDNMPQLFHLLDIHGVGRHLKAFEISGRNMPTSAIISGLEYCTSLEKLCINNDGPLPSFQKIANLIQPRLHTLEMFSFIGRPSTDVQCIPDSLIHLTQSPDYEVYLSQERLPLKPWEFQKDWFNPSRRLTGEEDFIQNKTPIRPAYITIRSIRRCRYV